MLVLMYFVPFIKSTRHLILDHLFCRLEGKDSSIDGVPVYPLEHGRVKLNRGKIHVHLSLRINYTTYDLQRESDHLRPSLNITRGSFKPHGARSIILVSTRDGDSPSAPTRFQYGRVLGIFHANAHDLQKSVDGSYQRYDFLWVHWFEDEQRLRHGLRVVPPISDLRNSSAFGIVDPRDVVRASHLLPMFVRGEAGVIEPSCIPGITGGWVSHYVGRYVFPL